MSVNVMLEDSSEASEAFSCPNCSSVDFHLELHCSRCGWTESGEKLIQDLPQPAKWKRIFNADVITFSVVFGIMNVMWLRLYFQATGIEMSLLQNLFYAVPFTLLFLLPAAVLRASLDALASTRSPRAVTAKADFSISTDHQSSQPQ